MNSPELRNILTGPRALVAAVAVAAGGLVVGVNADRADAAISGMTTTPETSCNFLDLGVFHVNSDLDHDVVGVLVAIRDDGSHEVLEEAYTIDGNDQTTAVLPESAEDTNIVFIATDGSGMTDPARNNCVEDEPEPEPEPTTTTIITTTTHQPTTTTSSSTTTTTFVPITTSSSSTTSSTMAAPSSSTTLAVAVGGENVSPGGNQSSKDVLDDHNDTTPTTLYSKKSGARLLALTGENERSLAAGAAVLIATGIGAIILGRKPQQEEAAYLKS